MSNRLDPEQARHSVGPDLDQNCLQRLSADDTSRRRVLNVLQYQIFSLFTGQTGYNLCVMVIFTKRKL